ncbi:hypothetical protein [Marinoscillum pacificum]|uniref:hypothetical protein n=1 Tax=Marinoscillum pacificum TaxID=392723 RepID=UPI0021577AD9|nr:hypothetical protein [Marinoscillum pacificum]
MNRQEVIEIIKNCLTSLYRNYGILIEKQVREETINERFITYLRDYFEVEKITVEPEYDKHIDGDKNYKTIEGETKRLRPDIVIHEIGTDDNNQIAFECKKKKITEEDEVKIDALIRQYNYRYGVLVEYNSKRFTICELAGDTLELESYSI